jgi:predicted deacylase
MPEWCRRLVATAVLTCSVSVVSAAYCDSALFRIDAEFEGGEIDECRFRRDDSVVITIRAEDDAVSDAFSWFAFRASAPAPRELAVKLRFPGSYARFWPKVSANGRHWQPVADDRVRRSRRKKTMRFRVTADADGTWVAAQELLTLPWYQDWLAALAAQPGLEVSVIGESVEGRPIRLAGSDVGPEAVILIGRQHPAEVPGALAMRAFTDVVLADTELARRFRERFGLYILPLLNPDGVVNGHARHNAGGTDLNRDWGPFTQPETRSVAAMLDGLDSAGIRPRLMLDFHATRMTPTMIFYTQVPEDGTDPPHFAADWLGRVDGRIDGYEFTHDPRPPSVLDNTKNYFFLRYGIPAITYEIGDEADRDAIARYTPVFAEEMMRTMLESD